MENLPFETMFAVYSPIVKALWNESANGYVSSTRGRNVDIHTVVLFVRVLLAAGLGGAGALPDRMAVLAAIPDCRSRGRGRAQAGVGNSDAASPGDPHAVLESTRAPLPHLIPMRLQLALLVGELFGEIVHDRILVGGLERRTPTAHLLHFLFPLSTRQPLLCDDIILMAADAVGLIQRR